MFFFFNSRTQGGFNYYVQKQILESTFQSNFSTTSRASWWQHNACYFNSCLQPCSGFQLWSKQNCLCPETAGIGLVITNTQRLLSSLISYSQTRKSRLGCEALAVQRGNPSYTFQAGRGRSVSGRGAVLPFTSRLIIKIISKRSFQGRKTTSCCFSNSRFGFDATLSNVLPSVHPFSVTT